MLTSITYISRSRLPPECPEIQDLWADALKCNDTLGITGALYFDGRSFLQYIEGPEGTVETLYQRIVQDARHYDVQLLSQTDLASRLFSFWSMKLIDASRSAPLQRAFDYDDICALPPTRASGLPLRLRKI